MKKNETKNQILAAGAEIIHEKGFNNTGLNEILAAAGVPKGSFYFYFKSKDDFGLALIDYYSQMLRQMHAKNGVHDRQDSAEKLFAFFGTLTGYMERNGYRRGCPLGNLVQEMSDINEDFRVKLDEALCRGVKFIAECLRRGASDGNFKEFEDADAIAGFIMNSFQGAVMRAKLVKNSKPFELFIDNIDKLITEE